MKAKFIYLFLTFSSTFFGQDFNLEKLSYAPEIDSGCIKNIINNGYWADSVFRINIDTLSYHFLYTPGLKLSKITQLEETIESDNISPDYFIDIGKGIYPNKKGFKLTKTIIYKRYECPHFQLEVNYFSTNDSIIKVVLFEWNEFKESGDIASETSNKDDIFKAKFSSIQNIMSTKLGKYRRISIPKQRKKKTYRSDIKWKSKEGLNAYLFMFSNYNNNYRQIRLAIYKD